MEIKRVALVGLGAIGGYLAPRLEAALGHDNFWVVASGERRARLEREGAVINGETYHFTVADPAEGAVLPADLVIFAVKWPQLAQAVEEVKLRSRQYAKRQLTWLRRNRDIHWILWEKERDFARALQISTEILSDAGVC